MIITLIKISYFYSHLFSRYFFIDKQSMHKISLVNFVNKNFIDIPIYGLHNE